MSVLDQNGRIQALGFLARWWLTSHALYYEIPYFIKIYASFANMYIFLIFLAQNECRWIQLNSQLMEICSQMSEASMLPARKRGEGKRPINTNVALPRLSQW